MVDINIFSLNTRGLGDRHKRLAVLQWLVAKKSQICFLQETHSTPDTEKDWINCWEGEIVFSHGASNSRGVAIMISKDLDITITKVENDSSGRFILLDCVLDNKRIILVNIYAPTINNKHDQRLFGEYLIQHLEHYIGENIILAGDFNINIENTHNCHYYKSLLQLIELLDLTDIWRLKNPHTVRYTRREKTRYGFKQTRIDFFLISCGLEYYINKVDILPSIKSDHSLLQISIHLENKQKQGKGF